MKKALIFLSVPVGAIIIAIIGLVLFVNPNQFKPLIIKQTKAQTGFDLVISGDIKWSFFPHLGFTIGETQLYNRNGFKRDQVLTIQSAGLDISVLPLLERRLDIGNVMLNGADIFVQKRQDGITNLDIVKTSMQASANNKPQDVDLSIDKLKDDQGRTQTMEAMGSQWKINLAGISINHAQLEYLDDTQNSDVKLSDVDFMLAQFAFGEWSQIEFNLKGSVQQKSFSAAGKTEFLLTQDLKNYQLRNSHIEAKYRDKESQIDKFVLDLTSFIFDKQNKMQLQIQGKSAGTTIDLTQSAEIQVDKAFSQIDINKLQLNAKVGGVTPEALTIDMSSKLDFNVAQKKLNFTLHQLAVNDVVFDGSSQVSLANTIPQIKFKLHSRSIDVDALLAQLSHPANNANIELAKNTQTTSANTKGKSADTLTVSTPKAASNEPDLSATRKLDVSGSIVIDKLVVSHAKLSDVTTEFKVDRGVIDLQKFAAKLYQGKISANAHLDARQKVATYTINNQVTGVQIQPLLKDVTGSELIAGTGNFSVNLNGKSLLVDNAKKNLKGSVKIKFSDGALYGVNIPYEVRSASAQFKGKTIDKDDVRKTDFSDLTATFTLANGVMKTSNMAVQSPLLRITGKGQANYIKQDLDFLINTSIVGSLKGQGGDDIDKLGDVTIPIHLSGAWIQPKISIDIKSLFNQNTKQKAQKEIDRGIDKLFGSDKDSDKNSETKKAVGGLLNKLFK